MRLKYLTTSYGFTFRELFRMRISLLLLFLIPTLFFVLVNHTTTDEPVDFVLSSVSEEALIGSTARGLSLVFIGIAVVGFVTSFLALSMVQKDREVSQRLVLCGYRGSELILSKTAVLVSVTVLIGIYVAALLLVFFRPDNWWLVTLGFILGGYVYGSYGLLVGSLFRRPLEGILLIVLLANIDAGWLQNPLYYTAAQNTALIRRLPAFYPSQVTLVSAFANDFSIFQPLMASVLYGSVLLGAALLSFSRGVRIRFPGGSRPRL